MAVREDAFDSIGGFGSVDADLFFEQLYAALEERSELDPAVKEDLRSELDGLGEEIARGEEGDVETIFLHLQNIRHLDLGIFEIVVSGLASPATGFGSVVENAIERMQDERESLERELESLRAEIEALETTLQDKPEYGLGTGAASVTRWEMDRALLERLKERAGSLERALLRVTEGTYGVCIHCGRPIHPDRLKVLPDTRICIRCAQAGRQDESTS